MNKLDSKPIRNPLAGSRAKAARGNSFTGIKEPGKNSLSFPTSRIGLVYRSLDDGVNLIENSNTVIRAIEREIAGE